jgi:transposase
MELDSHLRDQIIGMHRGGATHKAIGLELNTSTSSVSTTIRRYKATDTTKSRSRSGRPSIITPQTTRKALRDITDNPNRPWAQYGVDLGVSGKTVKKIAEGEGLHKRIARKKPFLKEVHITKRLDWARENAGTD